MKNHSGIPGDGGVSWIPPRCTVHCSVDVGRAMGPRVMPTGRSAPLADSLGVFCFVLAEDERLPLSAAAGLQIPVRAGPPKEP